MLINLFWFEWIHIKLLEIGFFFIGIEANADRVGEGQTKTGKFSFVYIDRHKMRLYFLTLLILGE